VIEPHGGSSVHLENVELTPQALASADCVVIITHHSTIDYEMVVEHAQIIVDTRNATKNVRKMREENL
jgi:UDP-N-acetyl-D-glucosamine dehydrogenase